MTYDTLAVHLQDAADIGEAATPMGMMLAWCVNMQLVSANFQQAHEQEILRVRMQELKGSELLVASGGDLQKEMFNPSGQAFLDRYYPRYLDDYQAVFGRLHGVTDDWESYAKISQVVTSHYMSGQKRSPGIKLKLPKWLSWGGRKAN